MAGRIRTLVDGLTAREIRSPYLDDLQSRAAAKQGKGGVEAVQAEILREMADSYSRAQRRVDDAFARLAELDAKFLELEQGADPADERRRTLLGAEFNEQRALAERRLWEFRVHRDSLGLARDDRLQQDYRLPPKRR